MTIIITLGSIIAAGNQPEKQETTDSIDKELVSSSSYFRNYLADFSNLSMSFSEFVRKTSSNYSSLFQTQLVFSPSDSDPIRLNKLFDKDYFTSQLSEGVRDFDETGFLDHLEGVSSLIPSYQSLLDSTGRDVEKTKVLFKNAIRGAIDALGSYSRKNIIHQIIGLLSDQFADGEPKEVKVYKEAEKTAYTSVFNRIKERRSSTQKEYALTKSEMEELISLINQKRTESTQVRADLQRFFSNLLKREVILEKMVRYSIAKCVDLVRKQPNSEEISTGKERFVGVLSAIIANAKSKETVSSSTTQSSDPSSSNRESDELRLVNNFVSSMSGRFKRDIDPASSESFWSLINQFRQTFYRLVRPVVAKDTLVDWMRESFTSAQRDPSKMTGITATLTAYLKQYNFPRIDDQKNDIGTKLIATDLFLLIDKKSLSDEAISSVIEDYDRLRQIDKSREMAFQKLKVFFTHNTRGQAIFRQIDESFYVNLYRLTAQFASSVSESPETPIVHLFDDFINDQFNRSNSLWMQRNYLVVKLFGLFFASKTSDFETSFVHFEATSSMVIELMRVASKDGEFMKALLQAYLRINGADSLKDVSFTAQLLSGWLSGKTLPAHHFSFVEMNYFELKKSEKVEEKRVAPNAKIHFVEDAQKRGSGVNMVVEEIGSVGKDIIRKLRHMTVAEFIDLAPFVEEKKDVTDTYEFIVVRANENPCQS